MKFVPDSVSASLFCIVAYAVLIRVVVRASLLFIKKRDKSSSVDLQKGNKWQRALVLLIGVEIVYVSKENLVIGISLCVILGSFLVASITDLADFCIYRFCWWLALSGCVLILMQVYAGGGSSFENINCRGLLVFILIQKLLFHRFYGEGDCNGFCVGALVLFCLGKSYETGYYAMGITFLLLGGIQGLKGNVGKKGNLKHNIALMPYIFSGLLVGILW